MQGYERGTIYKLNVLTACAARDLDNKGLRDRFMGTKIQGFLSSYVGTRAHWYGIRWATQVHIGTKA